MRAAYVEVQAGAEWTKITDLMITTYGTKQLEVYMKYGDAAPYEATPCAWKKVAETSNSWNGSYWKRVFPPWINGFDPVTVPPNQKVSFYIVNMGTGYGILGKYNSNNNRYFSPWVALDATSPVGSATMSIGRMGYNNEAFKPYPSYYRGYGIWGGFQLETMRPGSTQSPTAAPTQPYTPGSITTDITSPTTSFKGIQFDIENLGQEDLIVNSFSVLFGSAGSKHVEIWYREGSHSETTSGCDGWNNWCNKWTKLNSGYVTSLVSVRSWFRRHFDFTH
jgi:hypothetical protein